MGSKAKNRARIRLSRQRVRTVSDEYLMLLLIRERLGRTEPGSRLAKRLRSLAVAAEEVVCDSTLGEWGSQYRGRLAERGGE